MRAPLSWLREYAAIPEEVSPQEIADAFVRVGFEVEEIEMQGLEIVGPLVIGRVLSVEEITEFKKPIRWVGLDCGESETRFVVCGATNFAVDDLVVVALPGASLPGGFTIAQRETYGKISNGMICSSKEIGLSQDHEGILVLPVGCAVAGTDAIALLQIADVIFDIAVNPDRGYALSLRGLAREIAASLDVEYQDPVSSIDDTSLVATGKGVKVTIDDPSAASVVYIRTLEKFDPLAPTPLWMRRRIEKCGMRSISLAVDVTNYVMLELGQPLHAFDADKVNGSLRIRRAGEIATLKTLDGQNRTLDSMDLLVADDNGALALAGTMGGESSEVTDGTRRIALEAARFDPISIAKNSRRHRLSSEASRRLERGVDPSLARCASARAVHLLIELGGASHVDTQVDGLPIFSPVIELDPFFVSALTGANIDSSTVAEKLRVVGCEVEEVEGNFWKID
ncbi:MAG: phenylalanine--tRNA ligase subunit beta, partial [Streptomycetaceae bacterium]